MNHASFGAVPKPVLDAQEAFRQEWLAQPDELYFSGHLHDRMRQAAVAGATTLTSSTTRANTNPPQLPPEQVCLFENATVATCAVAYHWSKLIQPNDVVVYLDVAYKSCIHILKEYCERKGARLVSLSVPFPARTAEDIAVTLRQQLHDLVDSGVHPRFAFLDHVSSQPSILLPIADMIAAAREYGVEQVCVDGAHAVGSVPPFDVRTLDCDYYYSNLHKWAFAPSTATIFWSPHATSMRHPITSWAWGEGLAQETLFPGTRDFSAMAAVPAAVQYLNTWRSDDNTNNLSSAAYCHQQVLHAAHFLQDAWGVQDHGGSPIMDESLVATQAMVRLPSQLLVTDRPGQVSRGVRDRLREDYHIEASVGNFGEKGNFLRLSFAVYNNMSEIEMLAQAVLEIGESQK